MTSYPAAGLDGFPYLRSSPTMQAMDRHISSPPPIDVVDLFPEERQSLLALLSKLTEEEWDSPTICPGWSVKDIALHLLGVDLGNLSLRRDGFSDPWWQSSGDDLAASLNRFNETWVLAARRISPRLLCELLRFTGEAAARYFASLDLMVLGGPVSWAGPQPAHVWLDVAREYTERWVHQQQIRDAVGTPGLMEPRYLAPVLGTFVHALPHALRNRPATEGTVVRVIITGEPGGRWIALLGHDGWILGADTGDSAAATVTLDQDSAWRLWTKGVSSQIARTGVQIEGNPELASAVLEMVSVIA
jgi:uncharacterized protein (TIGR03083 family)